MMNFDELSGGFKYVIFLFSVPKLVKKSQFYPKGFGGGHNFKASLSCPPWVPGSVEYLHETHLYSKNAAMFE